MRISLRLTGLLAAVSMVISIPVTSGFACGSAGTGDHMVGMSTSGSANSVQSMLGDRPIVDEEAPASPAPPCDLPSGPSGCHSMVPCSPTAITAESVVVSKIAPAHFVVASKAFLTPPSETRRPELPPPRA